MISAVKSTINIKRQIHLSIGVRIRKVWFNSKEAIVFRTHVPIGWHGGMEPGWQHCFGGPS